MEMIHRVHQASQPNTKLYAEPRSVKYCHPRLAMDSCSSFVEACGDGHGQ